MECVVRAVTVIGVIEAVSNTQTTEKIIIEATDRAEKVASFLESIEEQLAEGTNGIYVYRVRKSF